MVMAYQLTVGFLNSNRQKLPLSATSVPVARCHSPVPYVRHLIGFTAIVGTQKNSSLIRKHKITKSQNHIFSLYIGKTFYNSKLLSLSVSERNKLIPLLPPVVKHVVVILSHIKIVLSSQPRCETRLFFLRHSLRASMRCW